MEENVTPKADDETAGMKIARWVAWIALAGLMLGFFVYVALFH
jgi:hypothetical protein